MNLKTLIEKLARGEPASPGDCEFLASCSPPDAAPAPEPEAEDRTRELEEANRSITAERDQAREELRRMRYRSQVDELSRRCGFTDAAYLEFRCMQKNLDLTDDEKVQSFVEQLRTETPRLFRIEAHPGPELLRDDAAVPAITVNSIEQLISEAPDACF